MGDNPVEVRVLSAALRNTSTVVDVLQHYKLFPSGGVMSSKTLVMLSITAVLGLCIACSGTTTSTVSHDSRRDSPEPAELEVATNEPSSLDTSEGEESEPASGVADSPKVITSIDLDGVRPDLLSAAIAHVEGRETVSSTLRVGSLANVRSAEVLRMGEGMAQLIFGDEIIFMETNGQQLFVGDSYNLGIVMVTGRTNYEALFGQRSGYLIAPINESEWNQALAAAEKMQKAEEVNEMIFELETKKLKLIASPALETWTDESGSFSVEARFVSYDGETLTLQREDTEQPITVPAEKLSSLSKGRAFDRAKQFGATQREIDRLQKQIDKLKTADIIGE